MKEAHCSGSSTSISTSRVVDSICKGQDKTNTFPASNDLGSRSSSSLFSMINPAIILLSPMLPTPRFDILTSSVLMCKLPSLSPATSCAAVTTRLAIKSPPASAEVPLIAVFATFLRSSIESGRIVIILDSRVCNVISNAF